MFIIIIVIIKSSLSPTFRILAFLITGLALGRKGGGWGLAERWQDTVFMGNEASCLGLIISNN